MPLVQSFSGIRGIYGKDLTDGLAVRYLYAYYNFLKNKSKKNDQKGKITLVIGMDTRQSSIKLIDTILGVLDCNFIDVGIASTPAVEFAVRYFNADGGLVITASHNEPYWNGLKFLRNDGSILNEKEMDIVISNFNSSKLPKDFIKIQPRKIFEKNTETIRKYSDFVLDIVGTESLDRIRKSKQKIVIDPNGGTGAIAKKILEGIGVEVIAVNMMYGEFNRTIEPTEDSLVYLKNEIDATNSDFAAGFDCDADRIGILMNNGMFLSGNCILALVVDEVLSDQKKNRIVVVNDATSNVVRDIVEMHCARLKEVGVGETNVVQEMQKSKSVIGGEGSSGGAVIWPSKCRDGILTLLMILSIIAKKKKKLHDIAEELPKYYNLNRKVEFNFKEHNKIKKYLKNYYSKKGFEIRENGDINGSLKVITGKNSFVWFRASKTESNIFRIISDSNKKEEAEISMQEAVEVLDNAKS